MSKLLNILLFPKNFYKKITDKKFSLYMGIIFIGIVDFRFVIIENFKQFFSGSDQSKLIYNISLTILFTLILGIMDVLFFSIPIYDLLKRFKKGEKSLDEASNKQINEKGLLIKLIKVYIVTHFLILPVETIIFFIYRNIENNINGWYLYIVLLIDLIIPFWFSAAISRGINAIYDFRPIYRKLVFLATYIWNYLLSRALSYVILSWILKLFKA